MDKHCDISRLLDFYGDVLSERQKLAMELYYNDDLSLSEVAEELGISRQGVRACLKKGEDTLRSLETALGLAERFARLTVGIESLKSLAQTARTNNSSCIDEFADRVLEITEDIEKNIF